MALLNVINCCLDSIRQISEDLEGSVLYLDAGCTESFNYLGAFPLLLELGVHAIHNLEDMSSHVAVVGWNKKFDHGRKIVVITSRLLSDAHRFVLRCLSTHQGVRSCTIFTSISEIAHSAYPDSPLGPDAFREYESLLVQDYEEFMKKVDQNSKHTLDGEVKDESTPKHEGWSQLTSSEDEISNLDAISSARDMHADDQAIHEEVVGQTMVVSVRHFPLILCPLSPRFFVLPSEGSVAEAYLSAQQENSVSPGLPIISTGTPPDVEDVPPGAALTAQFLYHLAAKMDLKLEIFSLGDLAKTVGKLITDMSSLYDVGRRKRSAGLLLIDRTLDLLTPCCHGDSIVDRIFSSVPRRARKTSTIHVKGSQNQLKQQGPENVKRAPLDVQIPLKEILKEEDSTVNNFRLLESIDAFLRGWNSYDSASQIKELADLSTELDNKRNLSSETELLSGSLVSTENIRGTPYLESILDRRTKDGTMFVKKCLQETLRKENISVNAKIRPGVPSKSELQLLIKALAKSQSSLVRNKGTIQLAAAATYAVDEKHSARWDTFISAEKMLKVSAGDTSQSLAAQMSDIINKSILIRSGQKNGETKPSKGVLSFQDALLLSITGYILAGENFPTSGSAGPFSWQEEHFLKEVIVDAVLENPEIAKLKFLHGLTEDLEANLRKNKTEEIKQDPPNTLQSDDFDDDQWGNWDDDDDAGKSRNDEQVYGDMQLKLELRDRVDSLFKLFHKLSSLKRSTLSREGALGWESNVSDDLYPSKGLLHKLLTRLLGKCDVPGLEYHSSTVGRLFKSGFGRFGLGQAKPSLVDQNVILVFILGGINAEEVRAAQEAISESGRPDIELVLGGTTLLTPDDMLDLLIGDSSYM